MKKVLIITCLFPPTNGIGVMRVLKYVKYLSEFGWHPTVLTVANPREPYDYALLKEIPKEVQIFRTQAIVNPSSYSNSESQANTKRIHPKKSLLHLYRKFKSVFFTDMLMGWIPSAIQKGIEIARKQKIDLIFVTAPPFSAYISGCFLKKKLDIPLIVDFRDAWVTGRAQRRNFNSKPKHGDRILERQVVNISDKVITATKLITQMMEQRYPKSQKKFLTITNGFDSDDLKEVKGSYARNEKFTISYTGSFPDMRTAKYFLKAVEKLISEQEDLNNNLSVSFIGSMKPNERLMLAQEPLRNVATSTPFIPHREAIQKMYESDVLLLVVYSGAGVLTGKIFEYIGVGRPILALVPSNGEAAQLIKENEFGFVVPPKNVEAIKEAIYNLYLQWKEGSLKRSNDPNKVKCFDRINLTKKLAEVFDEICGKYDAG